MAGNSNRKTQRGCLLLILLLLLMGKGEIRAAVAPDEFSIRRWHAGDGLPDERVYAIVQSADGYLWFGTERGASRFDGVRFVPQLVPQFRMSGRTKCSVLHAATDGNVYGCLEEGSVICWMKDGTRVFGTNDGMPKAAVTDIASNKEGAVFVGFGNGDAARIFHGKVSVVHGAESDEKGATYVAADGNGMMWRISGHSLEKFGGNTIEASDETGPVYTPFIPAREGGFWISSRRRTVGRFVPGTGYDRTIQLPVNAGVAVSLFEDSRERLWIGTQGGPGSGVFCVAKGSIDPVEILDAQVSSVTGDKEGTVWVATTVDGILQLGPRNMRYLEVNHPAAPGRLEAFANDPSGKTWTVVSGAVFRQADQGFEPVPPFFPMNRSNATSVQAAADGSMIIGTIHGLYRWHEGEAAAVEDLTVAHEPVGTLFRSRNGELWFSGLRDTAKKITRLKEGEIKSWTIPTDTNTRIFTEDPGGDIYFAVGGGRIFRIANDQIEEVSFLGAGDFPIHCLACDPGGSLWIGFNGGGIGRLKNGSLIRVTRNEGLPDDAPGQLLLDSRGRVWVNSDTNIYSVEPADFEAFASGKRKRLQVLSLPRHERELNAQGAVRSIGFFSRNVGRELWFTVGNRIVMIDPEARPRNEVPPVVKIEDFRVDGRAISTKGASAAVAQLSPYHRSVDFDFTALSFSVPENVRFRYKLEDYSADWVEAASERHAAYSRLAAGSYRFRVTACNSDGVWNEEGATVLFTVAPFFWQRWWFQTAVLAAAVFAGVLISRRIAHIRLQRRLELLEQKQMVEKERARIARNLHDDLGGSLTEVGLLADLATRNGAAEAGAENDRQTIASFSEKVRAIARTLDTIVWAADPANDTVRELATYLAESAQELFKPSTIRFRVNVDEQLPEHPLTPEQRSNLFLTAKEGLNNILKHSGAEEARLRIHMVENRLFISIADNGSGFDPTDRVHIRRDGLANMQKRVEELSGILEIVSKPGAGTKIELSISLPLTYSDEGKLAT